MMAKDVGFNSKSTAPPFKLTSKVSQKSLAVKKTNINPSITFLRTVPKSVAKLCIIFNGHRVNNSLNLIIKIIIFHMLILYPNMHGKN